MSNIVFVIKYYLVSCVSQGPEIRCGYSTSTSVCSVGPVLYIMPGCLLVSFLKVMAVEPSAATPGKAIELLDRLHVIIVIACILHFIHAMAITFLRFECC